MMEGTLKKFSEASKDSDYTKEIMKLDDKIEDVESLVEGSRELLKYDTVLLDRIDNASKKEKEKDKDGSIGLSARQEYGMFLFNDILVLTNAKNRIAAKLPNHLMSIVKIGPNEKRQRFRFRLETVTAGSLVFAVGSEKAYEEWVEALPKAFVARRRSQFFGVHLKDIMSRAEESANLAPYVVQLVMSYIRHNGIGSEGVFRISGKATAVARLRNKINAGKIIYFSDVSVCTTLLKMWLRELPVPLLTFDLYDRWTAAGEDAAKLRGCVNDLPECNQCLLYALMKLCKEIADHSDVNKMRADNLGIVIAPNILYERNAQADPLRCTKTNGVVSEIINNFDSVFADFVAKHTDKIDHYNKFMEHPQDSILMISAYEDTSAPASSPSAAAAALNEKVTTTDSKSCADSVTAASSSSTPEPIRDVQIPRMVFPTPQGTEVPFNPYAKAIAGASYAATAAVAAVSSLVAQGGIQALLSSTTTSGSSPASSLLSSSSPSSSSPITSTNTGPSLSATIGAPSPSPTVTAISSPSYVYHKHLHQPPPPPPTTAATAAITSAKGAEGSSSEMSSSSSSLSRESSLIFRRRTGHKRRGSTTSESSAAAATSMAGASQSDTMSGHSEVRSARSMSYSIAGLKFGKGKKEAKSTSRTSLCQRIKSRSDDGCAGLVAADENSPGVVCCATQDNGEDPKLVISAVDTANDSCVTPKSGLEESVSVVVDESDEIGVTEDDRSSSNNNNSSSSSKKKSSKGHRIKKSLEDEDVSVTAVNNTTINTTHQQQQQEESTPEETPRDDKKEKKKRKRKRSDSEVAGSGTDA